MKTSELTGAALNWAVARARISTAFEFYAVSNWNPSGNWAQGGPMIEWERLEVRPYDGERWIATDNLTNHTIGPTPLIAAMRCYVASKLGDEVEVPLDLLIQDTAYEEQ